MRETQAPEREVDVLREALDALRERLPASWRMRTSEQPAADGRKIDAVVRLTAPDRSRLVLLVEVKRTVNPRDVRTLIEGLEASAAASGISGKSVVGVIVARYLAPSTRERIAEEGAGYIDATGNIRLRAEEPALFLADRGADSDPWRGRGRPLAGLRGEPAARIVRALVDFAPPYSAPELAKKAGTSMGATYRVLEFLDQEDLIAREPYGPISDVSWREVLLRWSEYYGFASSNQVWAYLEPRGISVLLERLRGAGDLKYILTGSLAAERLAPYAPARQAMIYADDPRRLADALDLRPTDAGANVAIAAPKYDVVFERAETVDGLRTGAASQVAVDLLSGPGRNPSEAAALLDWMAANESVWRVPRATE